MTVVQALCTIVLLIGVRRHALSSIIWVLAAAKRIGVPTLSFALRRALVRPPAARPGRTTPRFARRAADPSRTRAWLARALRHRRGLRRVAGGYCKDPTWLRGNRALAPALGWSACGTVRRAAAVRHAAGHGRRASPRRRTATPVRNVLRSVDQPRRLRPRPLSLVAAGGNGPALSRETSSAPHHGARTMYKTAVMSTTAPTGTPRHIALHVAEGARQRCRTIEVHLSSKADRPDSTRPRFPDRLRWLPHSWLADLSRRRLRPRSRPFMDSDRSAVADAKQLKGRLAAGFTVSSLPCRRQAVDAAVDVGLRHAARHALGRQSDTA
jgi:hypothetical protein